MSQRLKLVSHSHLCKSSSGSGRGCRGGVQMELQGHWDGAFLYKWETALWTQKCSFQ